MSLAKASVYSFHFYVELMTIDNCLIFCSHVSCGNLAFKLVIACLANTASPSSSFYYIFFHILLSRTIGAAAKFTSAVLLHLFLAVHNAFRRFRKFRESSYLQVLGVLAQIKADKDSVEALVPPVENVDRLYQEIQALQKQVDDLEYKLDFRGQGVKSKEEIQLELNTLQSTKYKIFICVSVLE